MKIHQNIRHFATKKALTMPIVGDIATEKLVDVHMGVFGEWADPDHREEREDRMRAFFERTFDAYLAALDEGYPEAEAREITHIQANFDFFNHGWTEMMEFPTDEVEAHYERYADFFERHGVTIDDPLGEFAGDGLPSAPSTPERLENPVHPHAEGGFADDVYAEGADGEIRAGGFEEPDDVDVAAAPGVRHGDDEGEA